MNSTEPNGELAGAIKAHGLKPPLVARRDANRNARSGPLMDGQLRAAVAQAVLAAMPRKNLAGERVVIGETIPSAPKKQPSPPHVVPRGKLPRRMFRNRPARDPEGGAGEG